ncbi:nitrous oxide-stimulated promoter family protein [Campylobacter sp. 19-13652]|uniref:nitrous oxide-stimulated promoter family protein n=1 Tax=Campylobacter sp. 19-13652 TaxID=2840180 RepID=UPI001C76D59B|nr:nitrous oxide-stimulated promoter family protein [Campylobacter sp. 19-13652]BCX79127.1 hypothetical protein LBC_05890 [Campylobacter sp. 19-13652]
MDSDKFRQEAQTLVKFIQIYCDEKHNDKKLEKSLDISYKDINLTLCTRLCSECDDTLKYALKRLQNCPHEPKPKCRKCKNPCYEKSRYKHMAKIMVYSGVRLGLSKLKKAAGGIFKK